MNRFQKSMALAAALAFSSVASAEITSIKMGTEGAYPPFNSVDTNGNLVGFDIEIGNALCEAMKVECEWVTSDWDGIIPALLAKKFDTILASMSITEERKKKVAFSDKYYNTPAKFVTLKGSGLSIDAEGLKGKTIGVQSATTHENFLRGEYDGVVEVKTYGTQDEANLDLASGRVDAVLADSVVMLDYLASDAGKDAEFVGPEFSQVKYFGEGAGIAVRLEDEELLGMLNTALQQILEDGTYKAINAKYFDFNVYGD